MEETVLKLLLILVIGFVLGMLILWYENHDNRTR